MFTLYLLSIILLMHLFQSKSLHLVKAPRSLISRLFLFGQNIVIQLLSFLIFCLKSIKQDFIDFSIILKNYLAFLKSHQNFQFFKPTLIIIPFFKPNSTLLKQSFIAQAIIHFNLEPFFQFYHLNFNLTQILPLIYWKLSNNLDLTIFLLKKNQNFLEFRTVNLGLLLLLLQLKANYVELNKKLILKELNLNRIVMFFLNLLCFTIEIVKSFLLEKKKFMI